MFRRFFSKDNHCHGYQGMTFGAMDAIINVLGIVVGLGVIGNQMVVVLGLLVAGLANSFGNAAGFHVSEETEGIHTRGEVWRSTIYSFLGTFSVTALLISPLLFLGLTQAIITSVTTGIVIMTLLAVFVSRLSGFSRERTVHLVVEYVVMGLVVIAISFVLGNFASDFIGDIA